MSEDDIPEELRTGSEGPSDGFEDAITTCVQRNTTNLTITSIKPADSVAYASGNYEQRYQVEVFKPTNGGSREGVAQVDAYKDSGEWKADFVDVTLF